MSPDQKARMVARREALVACLQGVRSELRDIDAALAADRLDRWIEQNERRDREKRARANPVPFNERAERDAS